MSILIAAVLAVASPLYADSSKPHYECFLKIDGNHIGDGKADVFLYLSKAEGSTSSGGSGTTGEKDVLDLDKLISHFQDMFNANEDDEKVFEVIEKAQEGFSEGFRPLRSFSISNKSSYEIPINDIGIDQPGTRYLGFVMSSYFQLGKEPLDVPALHVVCKEKIEDVISNNNISWNETAYSVFSGVDAKGVKLEGQQNRNTEKYAVVPLHPGLPPQNVWEQLNPHIPFQPYDLKGYTLVAGIVDLAGIYDVIPISQSSNGGQQQPQQNNEEPTYGQLPGTITTYITGAVKTELDPITGEPKVYYEPLTVKGRLKAFLRNKNVFFYILTGDYNTAVQFLPVNFVSDTPSLGVKTLDYDIVVKARKEGYVGKISLVRDGEIEMVNLSPISWKDYKCLLLCDPQVIFAGSGKLYVPSSDNANGESGQNSQI
ncbi:MAG: hypothetical protein QXO76_00545 [Thermoproteota archaeon]